MRSNQIAICTNCNKNLDENCGHTMAPVRFETKPMTAEEKHRAAWGTSNTEHDMMRLYDGSK